MKSLILSAALTVGFASNGFAAVLFDNPLVSPTTGGNCAFECLNSIGAQSFELSADSIVESFSFEFLSNDRPSSFLPGIVNWSITTVLDDLPGDTIVSGSSAFTEAETTATGNDFNSLYNGYEAQIDIPDQMLSAGSYFLTLGIDTLDSFNTYWREGAGNGMAAESSDGGATWQAGYRNRSNMAITINGVEGITAVPLPAALPLLLIGLTGMGLAGRRRAGS